MKERIERYGILKEKENAKSRIYNLICGFVMKTWTVGWLNVGVPLVEGSTRILVYVT